MKNMRSYAFYALVTPAIALGSSAVLAQESTSQQVEQSQPDVQKSQGDMKSASKAPQTDPSYTKSRGYMANAPANGLQASNLMGVTVITSGDEEVGEVKDLIINKDGQVVGVVIGVGGFLGMGDKDVAIGWDEVQKVGKATELELKIDQSRETLMSAPEFETQK
ncbi:PRC-barrel domain-containing protein [Marinobacter sp. M216]|uniref:PRC-barrel domain-containing protein n=1 Tax=Marinobacter albus TaxID=3030833 RepID=A0ABT7HG46_9GAMM|nr:MULTISPECIES: PRC-barrel domain-containing protein [unclassified Marinobacter]MBW7472414.1 PRC-barrel domain-containing protein [Marinobacter sp. F4218]MDK9558964.1 PRC-barrel domain-containing protein [Marinobacter sp. M216]